MSTLSDERRSEIMLTNINESDCGVIALQAITGLARPQAEAVATEQAGYQHGEGVTRGMLNGVLADLGWKVERVAVESDGYTTATFAVDHEYGIYLLYTERHVMALIDGNPFNSRGDWHSPLEEAYKLTKD